MAEHIVAVFDSESAADAAAQDLEQAGISTSAVRRYRPTATDAVKRQLRLGFAAHEHF